ncbi:hypothetical protein SISSUDRAFT_405522 [Sistotremastrum suecicum HHB10207 ss-3]|uniref:ARM repeat-containing protein n=1 Tax=Sistotremastrum suecicum HHB10207 ss-3 TaxID=1314776 RepID=A0A165YRN1_9AGAM|nr:hypothetical protein SISSUDRAFT_405522 [Sistotremastrum suecicum HHB10207 ss-3]
MGPKGVFRHVEISMDDIAEECDSVEVPFSWDTMCDIVCRHLHLAISTPQDIKAIHKANAASVVVREIYDCFVHCGNNERVHGGILVAVSKIHRDAILAREIFDQGLFCAGFLCLQIHPNSSQLRELAIQTMIDLATKSCPDTRMLCSQALTGIPQISPWILTYASEPHMFPQILTLLRAYLSALNAYDLVYTDSLRADKLSDLKLPELVGVLVDLLETYNSQVPIVWDTLDLISEIFTWIAYYDSKPIEELPAKKVILLFVCFFLSPSLTIRCRSFLGLLNIFYKNCSREVRLCNPRMILRYPGYPNPDGLRRKVGKVRLDGDDLRVRALPYEEIILRYQNPSTKLLSDLQPFDPYEAALRFVDFELNGPSNDAESFVYPCAKLIGIPLSQVVNELVDDMEIALRFHRKGYEAKPMSLESDF